MLRVKRGRGGRGTNKGCPRAAVESKIAKLSLEITKLRHRVACREQSCHRRTRCAIPLPRLGRHFPNVSQDICSAPSSGAGRPTLAVENSYAVYRGGGCSPVMVWPVPPPPPPPAVQCTVTAHNTYKSPGTPPLTMQESALHSAPHRMGIYQFAHHWGCTPVCM